MPFLGVVLGMNVIGGNRSFTKGDNPGGWVSKDLAPEIICLSRNEYVPYHYTRKQSFADIFITKRQCFIQKSFSWRSLRVSYTKCETTFAHTEKFTRTDIRVV